MKRFILGGLVCSLIIIISLMAGCNLLFPSKELTKSEAEALAREFANAGTTGFSDAFSNMDFSNPNPQDRKSGQYLIDQWGEATVTCPEGGNIHVLVHLTGGLSDSGTGILLIDGTETISNYQCPEGFVVWGDPYISLAGHFTFVNGYPGMMQTCMMGGAFSWKRSGQEGTCQIQLTFNFNLNTGGGTISGSMCGQQVNESF